MDIPANSWRSKKKYQVNDIVRVGNFAVPDGEGPQDESGDPVVPVITDGGAELIEENESIISIEISDEAALSFSQEVRVGGIFAVDPSLGYSINGMVKKGTDTSKTVDPYKTLIKQKLENENLIIDPENSIGVGIGIKFYNSTGDELEVSDFRDTHRLMGSSELSDTEYYNVQLDIQSTAIPPLATQASLVVFVYGLKLGSFVFKQLGASNLSRFFYCIADHYSGASNEPNTAGGAACWTQDFVWRPAYNSKSNFAAIDDRLKMGEGADYVANLAINSLPMELSLSFENKTDKEARAIIHFLQEKFFPYESIFALDYKGNRLLSSDVGTFSFKYTYPYREDLKFTCTDFSHNKKYRNNNQVQAKFICNTESTLRNVESHAGFNDRLDALIPVFLDETTTFQKGVPIKLNTFSLESEAATLLTDLTEISKYPEDEAELIQGGLLSFGTDQDLEVGDCLYIDIPDEYDSIFDVGQTKVTQKLSDTEFVFSPIKTTGSQTAIGARIPVGIEDGDLISTETPEEALAVLDSTASNPATVKKLIRCPEDCITNTILMPPGVTKIEARPTNSCTGETYARILYTKYYRKLQLDSDINWDDVEASAAWAASTPYSVGYSVSFNGAVYTCIVEHTSGISFDTSKWEEAARTGSIKVTPLETFTLKSTDDFKLLLPAVRGRHSIYMKCPDEFIKYPWIKVRNFDHKPSIAFSIQDAPSHTSSKFVQYYNHKFKKGINQNLSTFTVTFDKRSDSEAAEILQFLESQLGYKKFRFQMPRPYLKDDSNLTTQARPYTSTFFCPSWNHQVIYKNNHTISATFIESSTSIEEDLRAVFGINQKAEEPCFGAQLFDPITQHGLCTFSSVLEVAPGKGFSSLDGAAGINARFKAVDIVFMIDGSGSMTRTISAGGDTYQKYTVALDVLKKIIMAYDDYQMPQTLSWGGTYNVPALGFTSIDGNLNTPPWAAKLSSPTVSGADISNYTSLIGELYAEDPDKDLNLQLDGVGYNLKNLERFKIPIDPKRTNIGFVLMTGITHLSNEAGVVIDISDYPDSFDKLSLLRKVNSRAARVSGYENFTAGLSKALAMMYNSPRAEYVTDRIIVALSDFVLTGGYGQSGTSDERDYNTYYDPAAFATCQALQKGGNLAKRRPKDAILKSYGGRWSISSEMERYEGEEGRDGVSKLINPDKSEGGDDNPSWYNNEIPTMVMPCAIGIPGWLSKYAATYAYDYEGLPPPFSGAIDPLPQFYFPITTSGDLQADELQRMMDLIAILEKLTKDDGYQNIFSITLHNCGPQEVTLLNSLINIKNQPSALKWSTETLAQGIPKGGSVSRLNFTQPNEGLSSIKRGYGGQFFLDPNNQNLFTDDSLTSNILWESFNTEFEVYRAGKVSDIGNGWAQNSGSTEGVKNTGVAFKGSPVRVFTADSGLQIVDYNIGNVVAANNHKGDYSHLPKLQPGEQLDLFFGVRVNQLSDFSEKVQIVINSDDGTSRQMECFGNYEFTIKVPSAEDAVASQAPRAPIIEPPREPEPEEPTEPEPEEPTEPEPEPPTDPESPADKCAEKFQLRSKSFLDLEVDTSNIGFWAFPGYQNQPIQKPYQGTGETGWYIINTESGKTVDWRAILVEAGYGETLYWEGSAGGDFRTWLGLAVGGLPATPGIILNQQGIDAGLTQWPLTQVSYSSQGNIGFAPGSTEFETYNGDGIETSLLPDSNTIKNFYKSTNGEFYATISQCLYFPAEADGSAPNNAKVFLDIVRQLCAQSPPADTPCTSWTRKSQAGQDGWGPNYELLIYDDIPTAPFLTGGGYWDYSGSFPIWKVSGSAGQKSICILEANTNGASPLFETVYQTWLQNCSEPDDPIVDLPPITSAPVDVVNPTPSVDPCNPSIGLVPCNCPNTPPLGRNCVDLFAN